MLRSFLAVISFCIGLLVPAPGGAFVPGIMPGFMVGAGSEITVILSNSAQVNISTLFTAGDWASPVSKRVIVPSGVTIGSASSAVAALRTGTGWGGILTVQVESGGTISGAGGTGNGGTGGTALQAETAGLIVKNAGLIRGGGGGGGQGGTGGTGYYEYWWFEPGGTDGNQWAYDGGHKFDFDEAVWFGPGALARIYWGGGLIWQSGENQYNYSNWPAQVWVGSWLYTRGWVVDGNNQTWTAHRQILQGAYAGGGAGGAGGRGEGWDGAAAGGAGGAGACCNAGAGGLGGTGGSWGNAGNTGATGVGGNAGGGAGGAAGGLAGYALQNSGWMTLTNTGTLQGRT